MNACDCFARGGCATDRAGPHPQPSSFTATLPSFKLAMAAVSNAVRCARFAQVQAVVQTRKSELRARLLKLYKVAACGLSWRAKDPSRHQETRRQPDRLSQCSGPTCTFDICMRWRHCAGRTQQLGVARRLASQTPCRRIQVDWPPKATPMMQHIVCAAGTDPSFSCSVLCYAIVHCPESHIARTRGHCSIAHCLYGRCSKRHPQLAAELQHAMALRCAS